MILYDHPASANCLKARILLRQLDLEFEAVTVDLFTGETKQPEHLARNPDGRVPVLELDSGELIPESGAILLHLGEGTPFLPAPGLERARVHQWMFFEQNVLEPSIGRRTVPRPHRAGAIPAVLADRQARGRVALESLDRGLSDRRPFIAGEAYSVADIALYAYVHVRRRGGRRPARPPRDPLLARARGGDAGVRQRPRANPPLMTLTFTSTPAGP